LSRWRGEPDAHASSFAHRFSYSYPDWNGFPKPDSGAITHRYDDTFAHNYAYSYGYAHTYSYTHAWSYPGRRPVAEHLRPSAGADRR
jgi:hypothetical protein